MDNVRLVRHFDDNDTRTLGLCWLWCSDAELLNRAESAGWLHFSMSRPNEFRVLDNNRSDITDQAEWNCANCLDTTREQFLQELSTN